MLKKREVLCLKPYTVIVICKDAISYADLRKNKTNKWYYEFELLQSVCSISWCGAISVITVHM